MTYHQLTQAESYRIGDLRIHGWWPAAIARILRRHPSTIGRELARNRTARGRYEARSLAPQSQKSVMVVSP